MILLMGIFMPYLSSAQTIIKVAGDVDAEMVTAQVNRSLDYLDIDEPMHLYIVFSERMPTHLKGITYSVETADSVKLIRVRINVRLDARQRINILAHEMIHVKQFMEGDLQISHNQKAYWKGKIYHCQNPTSRKNPWELEAYRHDQYLAKELKKISTRMPVLVASEVQD